jgi:energy-coupling factor transporter ATP-binding protein EcfA2
MGRVITETIFEGWDRIFGRAPAAQEIELDVESDPAGGPYLELKIKGPDGYYDLSERSLGFRWFFMFLLMTSFHGSRELQQRPLLLLDEPASNLHSTAQAELLKSFERLVDTCYLVYTTHSHHLINVRWLDAAYVVKNSALGSLDFGEYVGTRMGARTSIGATRYRQFVAEHPDQTSYFQPVLDLLDYRPSNLEPVPDVVLVEGKSDFYLIRYMMEVVGIASELSTVPGGDAGSLDPVIRLHIGWGKSFIVLLDGDAEGRKQAERYQREFGPLLSERCVLLPSICDDPNVKEAEDLLGAVDKEELISRVFAAGTQRPSPKKALRQAVIELYARREAAPIDATTVDRFQCLIGRLEERLLRLAE